MSYKDLLSMKIKNCRISNNIFKANFKQEFNFKILFLMEINNQDFLELSYFICFLRLIFNIN